MSVISVLTQTTFPPDNFSSFNFDFDFTMKFSEFYSEVRTYFVSCTVEYDRFRMCDGIKQKLVFLLRNKKVKGLVGFVATLEKGLNRHINHKNNDVKLNHMQPLD